MAIDKNDIRNGLERLGLRAGDYVIAHSSFKSFGAVEGGPAAVVEALLETVGEQGLLMMPTYGRTENENGDLVSLDPATAVISTGIIPTTFARDPRACRGLHPLYSITFAGQWAGELARENERLMFPYGLAQPFNVLLQERGFMLLMGVGNASNSAIHMLEEIGNPPYLQEKKSQAHLTVEEFFAMPIDRQRESLQHHRAGPQRDFTRLDPLLHRNGDMPQIKIGNAIVSLVPTLAVQRVLEKAMRKDPYFLVES